MVSPKRRIFMYTLKRLILYTLIILLIISIFQDLMVSNSRNVEHDAEQIKISSSNEYTIAHVKVLPGDTIFSIVESLNADSISMFHSEDIIKHFKELNPTTDPHKLKPDTFYYFPLYQ